MYAEDKFIEPKTLGLRDATSAKKLSKIKQSVDDDINCALGIKVQCNSFEKIEMTIINYA